MLDLLGITMAQVERASLTLALEQAESAKAVQEGRPLLSSEIPERIEWVDGALSGSLDAMRAIDELIASGISIGVTPTGPFIDADKSSELSAFVIGRYIFRGALEVSGDPPDLGLAELPEGAIP